MQVSGCRHDPSFLQRHFHSEPAPSTMIPRIPTTIRNHDPGNKYSQGKRPGHGSPESSTGSRQDDIGSYSSNLEVDSTKPRPARLRFRCADHSPVPKEATVITINPLVPQDLTV